MQRHTDHTGLIHSWKASMMDQRGASELLASAMLVNYADKWAWTLSHHTFLKWLTSQRGIGEEKWVLWPGSIVTFYISFYPLWTACYLKTIILVMVMQLVHNSPVLDWPLIWEYSNGSASIVSRMMLKCSTGEFMKLKEISNTPQCLPSLNDM